MKNLTKLLLGLGLLLASSVTAQAQNVFNHPSVIDPSNITLFSGITLSQMSAGVFQNYIIQNPWKYNNITISLTATTSSHSLQIIVLCSPDANASDATISNNNSGVVTMTMSSSAGVVGFTPSIANGINMAIGAGIPTKVSVPITGCAVIDIQLFQAVGAPLTDTFSGKALLNDF